MQQKEERYLSPTPPPLKRERGPLLTIWLIFFIIINVYATYVAASTGNILSLSWATFGIICGIGTWLWYKYAFYGMLLGYLYNVAVALDNRSVESVVFSLVFLALTYFLVQQKMEFFR